MRNPNLAVTQALATYFDARWGTTTPVEWPNQTLSPEPGESWLRYSVQMLNAGRELMTGDPDSGHRYLGNVTVQVNTPLEGGDGPGLLLGDQVANLFRERRLAVAGFTSSIAIATPKVFTVGKSGGWWQTNVIIPFDFVAI